MGGHETINHDWKKDPNLPPEEPNTDRHVQLKVLDERSHHDVVDETGEPVMPLGWHGEDIVHLLDRLTAQQELIVRLRLGLDGGMEVVRQEEALWDEQRSVPEIVEETLSKREPRHRGPSKRSRETGAVLTYEEIGTILGISREAVLHHYQDAMRRLRDMHEEAPPRGSY